MADVFPRRNLPDDASQWGRAVEKRTEDTEAGIVAVRQSLQSLNRNTASSLETLANQIQEIEAAQDELEAQQASIIATQTFLATQTVSDSRSNADSYTGSNSGITWVAFNSTYDCSVPVVTGSAGKLLIQASANLTGGGLTSILGIEIVGVSGPTYPGPLSTYVTNATSGATRVISTTLSPNTAYTVRIRRGIDGSASGVVAWGYQTLVVTRS